MWDEFSTPVKTALRWAWASAQARSGDRVDSIDLLIGIMLADLTSSPATVLLDHFGIPPGEVVARPDYAPPTAKALLAGWESLGMPEVDVDVDRILRGTFVADGELWSLRFLFLCLLEERTMASSAINAALSFRGFDFTRIVGAFRAYVSGRDPLRTFLEERFPYQAASVALPGYLTDQPDRQLDLIGIGPEVNAFAHLMASRRLVPPLAMGLFGEWGAGKSYFLRCLRSRIAQISDARLPAFHQAVVQVEFNAWQYVDGDLWASLVEHLFRNLRRSSGESDDLIAQRQRFWVQQVQQAGEAHQQAQSERRQLEQAQQSAADAVEARKQDLAKAETRLAEARKPDASAALKQAVREAAKTAGVGEVVDNATRLAAELDQTRADLRSLLTPLRDPKYLRWVVAALVAAPLIGYLAQLVDLSAAVSTVSWLLGTAAVYAGKAGQFLRDASRRIADARAKLAEAEAEETRRNEQAMHDAKAKLDEVRSELDAAVARERELAGRVAEVRRTQEAETPGQVLTDFITDRTDSDDYRRHLGVPALVRRDLDRLSRLVKQQVPGEYAIDRIVLYIDDLDRCPTPVVIKVLEAVHLLLAFPLFVVVVAVDARWLTSSLRDHFRQLSGPDATPQDYLEKIFQVPFLIQSLSGGARAQMLRGVLTPSLVPSDQPQGTDQADESGPVASTSEFEEVVASFSATAGPRQALSDTVDLTITSAELQQAQHAAEAIGATPRAVKRFVNVYLLVKSIGAARGLRVPEDGRLVTLVATALGTGAPPAPSDEDPEWLELIDRFRFPGERRSDAAGRMDE